MVEELQVPIHLKMTLTIKEAAAYSNIGINKIDSMLRTPNCPFVLFVGTKKLVKRREFEQYHQSKAGDISDFGRFTNSVEFYTSLRRGPLYAIIILLQ